MTTRYYYNLQIKTKTVEQVQGKSNLASRYSVKTADRSFSLSVFNSALTFQEGKCISRPLMTFEFGKILVTLTT